MTSRFPLRPIKTNTEIARYLGGGSGLGTDGFFLLLLLLLLRVRLRLCLRLRLRLRLFLQLRLRLRLRHLHLHLHLQIRFTRALSFTPNGEGENFSKDGLKTLHQYRRSAAKIERSLGTERARRGTFRGFGT